jgi:Metallo-peptidase family M12B Reprolysin-like/Calx-beta domain
MKSFSLLIVIAALLALTASAGSTSKRMWQAQDESTDNRATAGELSHRSAVFKTSLILAESDEITSFLRGALATRPQTRQSVDGLWRDADIAIVRTEQAGGPRAFRSLTLNIELLQSVLRQAPKEFSNTAESNKTVISLPIPDGNYIRFEIQESPVMERELAAKFPEIKTYRGQGIDEPSATTRFDWTPQGFHGIVLSTRGTILIEPETSGRGSNYLAYFQADMPAGSMECDADEATQVAAAPENKVSSSIRPRAISGSSLRTYRLAVAATGEYTQTYGGGTVSGGLSAVTTTVNLVDAIYESEVTIRLVLIANEDSIIFTDAATDGYTSDDVGVLIGENQTKLDSVIGSDGYDIGHVFDGRTSTGFSWQGQASIASVCRAGFKARGVSITRNLPPSSIFTYYSTAHEMGHQFGASHTFNATTGFCGGQRAPATAYEPGTGSTIMGYRLNCGSEDLMSSNAYFHNASIEQITTYTTVGGGACGAQTPTGNSIPTVAAGSNYTIPKDTPFVLTATGSDPDGDPLTYCWEEFDLGNPSPPNTDDGTRPIFRSFAPISSPRRTFPAGADTTPIVLPFESLPITTRVMNFRVTVRDNRGGINSAGMQLSVRAEAGRFNVIDPSGWVAGSNQTVNWNVANTDQPPVSCSSVRIRLSLDGGLSFPFILANNTPNDGSEIVAIPGFTTGSARIKVEAVGNVFFNVSSTFGITGIGNVTPTITGFSPSSGLPGTIVTINGTNFLNPSAVRFNGIDASFTLDSVSQIFATVPPGATNGLISVTTGGGTAFSSSNFGSVTYSVSGHIAGNNPIGGATVTFEMNFQGTMTATSTTTDGSGNYVSGNLGCQNSVRVTPSKTGFTFTPLSTTFVSTGCLNGSNTANFTDTQSVSTQFSQSAYSVNEGAGHVDVTVTRSGDTSGTASVDYRTTDTDTFAVGCSDTVNNAGGAYGRCDYATSVDTLTFLAGETTKTFAIPIIDDSLHEGNETFSVVLSNVTGARLGTPATATITIIDNDTVTGPNPIFTTPFFVRLHYLDFLSREPEVGEPWTAVLNNCSDVNNNPLCDRLTVSAAFFGSPEFRLKGFFVYRFYKLAFNRLPTYPEIVTDMRAVTGQTPAEVYQKKAAFTNSFVQRGEFATVASMPPDQYVATLMGRYNLSQITTLDPAAPDGPDRVILTTSQLMTQLSGGTLTRAQVLRAIADSDQVTGLEFYQAFVAMQYYGYLRRAPETAGYNAWLAYLTAHPLESRTMVNGFMNSIEYRMRFGPQ